MQSNQQTPVPEHPEEDDYARNFDGWEGDDYGHGWEDEATLIIGTERKRT
jgi:hypothetical protein